MVDPWPTNSTMIGHPSAAYAPTRHILPGVASTAYAIRPTCASNQNGHCTDDAYATQYILRDVHPTDMRRDRSIVFNYAKVSGNVCVAGDLLQTA